MEALTLTRKEKKKTTEFLPLEVFKGFALIFHVGFTLDYSYKQKDKS